MISQINFKVRENTSKVKAHFVWATNLIEVIGPSKISSINGSFPSVYFSSLCIDKYPDGGFIIEKYPPNCRWANNTTYRSNHGTSFGPMTDNFRTVREPNGPSSYLFQIFTDGLCRDREDFLKQCLLNDNW